MKSMKIAFASAEGEPLAARLEMPASPPIAYALFAHCFTCGKDSSAAVRTTRALAARNIATFRFDFTGLGQSGGDFANTNFSSNVADLVSAASYLREHHQPPQLLIGHSLGGAAVIAAAHLIPEARAVVTIGAPSDAAHVAHHFAAHTDEMERTGQAEVSLAGRRFTVKQQFIEDLKGQDQKQRICQLKRALLVLHAPTDEIVGIENAAQIFQAAKHPKSFVSLHEADHLLSRSTDADYAASMITAWAARYVHGAQVGAS
ncbi:MAG: alpha/beta fold hydrolase [Alphaproteobacteria bacterium]|nr:alpha/beta fold hydrolase [Alphaproteobacteria bacterium]